MFYTYFHTRNDTGAVFYVGKGTGSRAHGKGRNPHWANVAEKHGHQVHFATQWATEKEAFEHEKFLILCFKDMGIGLTNMSDGGEGASGVSRSGETRRKIGEATRTRHASPEYATKHKLAICNALQDPTKRENQREAARKRMFNPVERERFLNRMAQANLNLRNPGTKGFKMSLETKAKMRASALISWSDLELKAARLAVIKSGKAKSLSKKSTTKLLKEQENVPRRTPEEICW